MGVVAKAVSDFILFISNKTVLSTGAAVVLGGKKQPQKTSFVSSLRDLKGVLNAIRKRRQPESKARD